MAAAVIAVGAVVAGAAASSAVGAVVGAGLVGAAAAAVAGAAVTVGISYLGQAIVGGPSPPGGRHAPADAMRAGRTRMVIQPITDHRIVYGQVRVGGPLVFFHVRVPAGGSTRDLLHLVVVHAAHECHEIGEIYLNDDALGALDGNGYATGAAWVRDSTSLVRAIKHPGTADQAADGVLVANSGGRWTSAHRLRGRAYSHLELRYHEEVFASGVPNISAVVKGRKVYDPRSTTTAWSDNAALAILDYLVSDFGLGADLATEIDHDSFIAAANVCDEQVAKISGTEARYTCNGTVDLGGRPIDILESLLSSCAGRLVFTAGRWRLHPGVYSPPILSVTESFARAPVLFKPRRGARDLVNTVRGAFTSPDHAWQPSEYPPVAVAGYVTADGGEAPLTLDLPFTTSHTMAQRIARIALEQNRREAQIAIPANLAGLRVAAGDTVTVSLERFGLVERPFTVAAWRLSEDGGVDLSLTEESADVYAHSAGLLKDMT